MPTTIVQIGLVTNRVAITTQVGLIVRFNDQHVNKSSSCNRFPVHPLVSPNFLANKVGFISNLCFQFPMCVLCVCGELFLIKVLFPTTTLGF
jgi:hypothetical protein